jgi:pimeloyl-ACP methyl ester carboxylesterase
MSDPESPAETKAETRAETHGVDNGAGWQLSLRRVPPSKHSAPRRPVLIVPGYGMNSFIFGFHPHGLSLEAYLAVQGLEVWSVDLRAQGQARYVGTDARHHDRYGLADLAIEDLGAGIGHVLANTRTGASQLDIIGASLGASLAFAHLACLPKARVHTVVSMGGLVTWTQVPPLVRALFFSRLLAGNLRLKGTRALAGVALPALGRWAPGLLSMYLHTQSTDIAFAATMIKTVEDPNPHVNREISDWISRRELIVRDVNVSRALRDMRHPFLCVVANQDGIVPPATAQAPYDEIGSPDKMLLKVGDAQHPIAHADLFVSTGAQELIFAKIADFLIARA